MNPHDDWAPLSAEQRTLHPGERSPGQGPTQREGQASGDGEAAPVDDAAAQQLVRALQEKADASGPSESLVAALRRRQAREERCRAAEAAAAATAGMAADGGDARLPEFELGAESEVDPRELEPWFLQLPDAERARLRAVWSRQRHRFDGAGEAARTRLLRAAAFGAAMFVCNGLLMVLLTGDLWRCLLYAPVGAAAGLLGQCMGGLRFHYMAAGALGFVVVEGANVLANPIMLYGLLFAISSMALVGLDREMRVSGGERDD